MKAIAGDEFGRKFCEILGVDPSMVASLNINANSRDVVKVSIERYVRPEEASMLYGLLSFYTLGKAVNEPEVAPVVVSTTEPEVTPEPEKLKENV
jgi:hypothetical protein